ncbi:MAG: SDR family oxidoreductase [Eubacteriales bacterium]
MLIENMPAAQNSLFGKTIIITGAGGGIGFEAAKALAYMGAKIIIAEINAEKGKFAETEINNLFYENPCVFYEVDLSDEKQIYDFIFNIKKEYGCPDVIINNATITAMGAVDEVPIEFWEKSYLVNFKAPLILTKAFLPIMKERNSGTICFVPSSGAAPYMGAYEVFKTAQVELCNTLAGELEKTNVKVFSIGPGLVKTETAMREIETVSKLMGMSVDEFYKLNERHIIGAEEAGTGFALSVLMADKYNGQEIGSIQVLLDAGILETKTTTDTAINDLATVISLTSKIIKNYREQQKGWFDRNVFERQWVLRDFKKTVGYSAEQFFTIMENAESIIKDKKYKEIPSFAQYFIKLKTYYEHQYKLLQGFEKNPERLKENSGIINQWISDLSYVCDKLLSIN